MRSVEEVGCSNSTGLVMVMYLSQHITQFMKTPTNPNLFYEKFLRFLCI